MSVARAITFDDVARLCHEANRAWCVVWGDLSQVGWDEAPEWQRKSAVLGVKFVLGNPDAGDAASHESWLAEKERDGWVFGEIKDPEKKTHPCMVPFDRLPWHQQQKDRIFRAIALQFQDVLGR